MIEKYGKPVQMRQINRNLDNLKRMIEDARTNSERFYKEADTSCMPKCRICGRIVTRGGVKPFVQVWGKYDYYECENCGSVFLHNLPDMGKMYAGDNTANGTLYIDDKIYTQRVDMISAPKVRFVLETCREARKEVNQWTDIGCGGGEILYFLKNMGIRAIGVESDNQECKFAAGKGLEVYNHFINIAENDEKMNELIQKSDVVSLINVLEHMEDPAGFVTYLWERMKPGAVLVFEVPRHPSVASFVNQTHDHAVYRHIVAPIHFQVFSEKSLEYMLGDRYEMIGKWEFGQGYTDLINNAMFSSGKDETPLYIELMNLNNRIQPIFDEAGYADQMLIVARKNE